jgi:hypothetical protein
MGGFEYSVMVNITVSELNAAGADGWELVSVVTSPAGSKTLYLKRRRTNGQHETCTH